MLDAERLERELGTQADRFATLVGAADPDTPVPTCPEWTVTDLVKHVGGSTRWMTTIVATRATEVVRFRDVPGRRPPEDPAAVPDWLRAGAADLLAAIRSTGADTPVWSWAGGSAPAAFWLRRGLYELAVHTADAAIATGAPVDIDPDVAADGVSEWLEIVPFIPAATVADALGGGRSVHLHATDTVGEWSLRGTADGLAGETGHTRADVAVRAAAASLFLLLYRRLPADDPHLEIHGDRPLLDRILAAAAF